MHTVTSEIELETEADSATLPAVVEAVQVTAEHMLALYSPAAGLLTRQEIAAAIHTSDLESLRLLRPRLEAIRPAAGWVDDELDTGQLPDGEWWVTDPVEGAINFVHGIGEWAITATLVRDNSPVLTVVVLPIEGSTYTAVRGGGARLNGTVLRVSAKTHLDAALVGTGQASPRETAGTFQLLGRTIPAMMSVAGVVRVSVPPTLQLVHVAAGRMDVFWQHSAVRSGLLPGALLVDEAGGTITDLRGMPWVLGSADFLATAPGIHSQAVAVLSSGSGA